jgi:hypothetical protein
MAGALAAQVVVAAALPAIELAQDQALLEKEPLRFIYTHLHDSIRAELDLLSELVAGLQAAGSAPGYEHRLLELKDKYRFLEQVYKYHSSVEDEVRAAVLSRRWPAPPHCPPAHRSSRTASRSSTPRWMPRSRTSRRPTRSSTRTRCARRRPEKWRPVITGALAARTRPGCALVARLCPSLPGCALIARLCPRCQAVPLAVSSGRWRAWRPKRRAPLPSPRLCLWAALRQGPLPPPRRLLRPSRPLLPHAAGSPV